MSTVADFQNGKNDLYRSKIKSFDNQHSISVADFKTKLKSDSMVNRLKALFNFHSDFRLYILSQPLTLLLITFSGFFTKLVV